MKIPKNQHLQKYVSDTIKNRMEELGISRYRLLQDNPNTINETTFRNILKGSWATNIHTLAHYCDLLGLEIVIQPKKQGNETDNR